MSAGQSADGGQRLVAVAAVSTWRVGGKVDEGELPQDRIVVHEQDAQVSCRT